MFEVDTEDHHRCIRRQGHKESTRKAIRTLT